MRAMEAPPALEQEAIEILQRLIRFDTVNPPGNERPAQEYLASLLERAGFACELLGASESRPNLVARLDGTKPGSTLCLLSHVDTVLANAADWSVDPWSGELAEGFVWGRGALDMKSQTAAEVAAACALGREGWRPAAGSLLIVCLVDEETGGELGSQWLTRTHPEKVHCEMLINEGGGGFVDYGEQRLYFVGCAEKGVFRFTLTTEGAAAHASMPRLGENALIKLAPLLLRLGEGQPAYDRVEEPLAFLAAIGELPEGEHQHELSAALERLGRREPRLVPMLEPMLGVSLAPTRVSASEKINVTPSQARLQVDCRVPPGLGEEHALARVHEVLGEGDYRIEFSERVVGNRSRTGTPLWEFICDWVGEHAAQARCVPAVLPGFTDSRAFRDAFPECVAYGFFPHLHQDRFATDPLVHGADERIDVRDLAFATSFFREVAERMLV